MKKISTLLLGGFFFITQAQAQLLNPFFDQLIDPPVFPTYYWPSFQFLNNMNGELITQVKQGNTWVNDDWWLVTKDSYGFFTNHKNFSWNPATNQWDPEMFYEATLSYNAQGRPVMIHSHYMQGSEMENKTHRDISYLGNGNYGSITGLDSMYFDGMWMVAPFYDSMIYNNGKIVRRSVVSTNPAAFTFEYRLHITYNAQGKVAEARYQNGFMGMFQDWLKYLYSYNATGEVECIRWFTWNENTNAFIEEHRDSLYYPSPTIIRHVIHELDDFNNLVPTEKAIFSYDASGNLQTIVTYEYNNGWVLNDSTIYIYGKGLPQSMFVYDWTGSGWSAEPISKGIFNNLQTGIPAVESKLQPVLVSPNPVRDYFTIQGLKSEPALIQIFDVNGHQIAQRQWTGQPIDVKELSTGVYSLLIKQGNNLYRSKLVKW